MTTPSYLARQVDCRWRCAGDVGDGERVYEHGDRDRPLPGRRAAPQAARQPPTPARAHLGPGRCPVVRTARRRTQQHRTGDQIFWPDHPVAYYWQLFRHGQLPFLQLELSTCTLLFYRQAINLQTTTKIPSLTVRFHRLVIIASAS